MYPGGGHGKPLQYSCLENPQDRGAWGVYSPEGHKESDTTEDLTLSFFTFSAPEIREHLENDWW